VRALLKLFPIGHLLIGILFMVSTVALLAFALISLWETVSPGGGDVEQRLLAVLEAISVLTIAVASLELGQTIIEEEVQREAQMAAPTRVRRFLSRFMVVLVVALSIESLVAAFRFSHEDPSLLPYAASVGGAAALLLVAWGVFVRLNVEAEKLEPDAMQQAKEEDEKLEQGD
jgi:hypothetical protein